MSESVTASENSTALVPVPESFPLLTRHEAALARMSEKEQNDYIVALDRLARLQQLRAAIAFKRTYPQDWVVHKGSGGAPDKCQLMGTGAERVAAFFGLRINEPHIEAHDRIGDDLFITVSLLVEELCGGQVVKSLYAIGHCDSRDQFYAGSDGQSGMLGKAIARCGGDRWMAVQSLRDHILKKAVENAKGRGVTGILGFRNMTPEQLAALGIKTSAVVEYKKGTDKAAREERTGTAVDTQYPFVPVSDLSHVTDGSFFCTQGKIDSIKPAKTSAGKDKLAVVISGQPFSCFDMKSQEWAKPGTSVICTKVKAGLWGQTMYYTINNWEALAPSDAPALPATESAPPPDGPPPARF